MLGKYRLERKLGVGGFARVYRAFDTLEGVRVALKIPFEHRMPGTGREDILREVRLTATLDHPNVLRIKDASIIDDQLVIAYPLADQTLEARLKKRVGSRLALDLSLQLLDAVAYAHERRVMHLDIKPENILLFPGGELKLGDFGIAKVALRTRTIHGSGAGTIGYIAPEQALGKPSFRSDVFCVALVIYRMFSGRLPEWPFEWPPIGYDRLARKLRPEVVEVLRRALAVDQRLRYRDAVQMRRALRRHRRKALQLPKPEVVREEPAEPRWKEVRQRDFRRRWGKTLGTTAKCEACEGVMSPQMRFCPWCSEERAVHEGRVDFPRKCPRCGRGAKTDFRFCGWCHGGAIGPASTREYPDRRYEGTCENDDCERGELMPFMRYCPWCRRKVHRAWNIEGSDEHCEHCGWGVVGEFFETCPWCGKARRSA